MNSVVVRTLSEEEVKRFEVVERNENKSDSLYNLSRENELIDAGKWIMASSSQ